MRETKGQSAIEYLLILSAMLFVLTAIVYPLLIVPARDSAGDTLTLSQARAAVQTIGNAVNTVYYNGRGAVMSGSFQMDKTWNLRIENGQNRVIIVVTDSSLTAENLGENLKYPVKSQHSLTSIPPGTYTIIVEWPENGALPENVWLGPTENKKLYIRMGSSGGG